MKYLTLFAALLIAGCSSTPQSNYYLLSSKATGASAPCDCSIGIGPVTVAEYLNRPQITVSSQAGQLNLEQFHRWGEPLQNSIERVLLENLATLTGSSELVIHPWRQSQQPRYRVTVNVLTMDKTNGSATIKVQWHLTNTENKNESPQTQLDTFSSPLANDEYSALAEGFSDALLQLSQKIANSL
ncbi:PqiC family protein [Porticoccus sp. W117]|uniref:PqiC family protein n=1 Tax=Porticoccus sp. W117 TaxID=3054777 RepID=UPI002592ED30|nr:PqiC family protein [Porticoccus sp. W117]MDM3870026.1 PqiC family protein [Porticoccus sp. W117]